MARTDVHIRDARLGDAPIIAEFNIAMARETEDRALDMNTVASGVRQVISRPHFGKYFVAEADGKVIGCAMITFEWSDWRDGVFWWFQSVYVLPDYRRQGVFTMLYRYITAQADNGRNVIGLRLYVEQDNEHAKRTYEKLGMKPSGHLVYEVDWSGLGR